MKTKSYLVVTHFGGYEKYKRFDTLKEAKDYATNWMNVSSAIYKLIDTYQMWNGKRYHGRIK